MEQFQEPHHWRHLKPRAHLPDQLSQSPHELPVQVHPGIDEQIFQDELQKLAVVFLYYLAFAGQVEKHQTGFHRVVQRRQLLQHPLELLQQHDLLRLLELVHQVAALPLDQFLLAGLVLEDVFNRAELDFLEPGRDVEDEEGESVLGEERGIFFVVVFDLFGAGILCLG